jgi:multiple sugar transport system permease protein
LWVTGNAIVIFLAGLQQIPRHLYEATEIDGGNSWHKLIHITIPMASPIIFFNIVIGTINAFQTFVQTAILTPGAGHVLMGQPKNAGLLYVPYVYTKAFTFSEMGSASASALILLVAIGALTFVFFKIQNRHVYYERGNKK